MAATKIPPSNDESALAPQGSGKVRKQDRITLEALQQRFDRPLLDVVCRLPPQSRLEAKGHSECSLFVPLRSGEGVRSVSDLYQENGNCAHGAVAMSFVFVPNAR